MNIIQQYNIFCINSIDVIFDNNVVNNVLKLYNNIATTVTSKDFIIISFVL